MVLTEEIYFRISLRSSFHTVNQIFDTILHKEMFIYTLIAYLCICQSISCGRIDAGKVRSVFHNELEDLENASYRLLGDPKQLKSIWSNLEHRLATCFHRRSSSHRLLLSESKAKKAWFTYAFSTTFKWYKSQWQPYFKSLPLNQKRSWARYIQRHIKTRYCS